jgi:hypothetical protein
MAPHPDKPPPVGIIGRWEATRRDAMTAAWRSPWWQRSARRWCSARSLTGPAGAMIGYIAAGLVVGPFTPGIVAGPNEVLALADIGVALLMFHIGLRFQIGERREVGRLVGIVRRSRSP